MKIRICASIAARTITRVKNLMGMAESLGANLLELRMDYLKSSKGIRRLVKSTSLPLIATNRNYEQGGFRFQKEEQRIKVLLEAADIGFNYVDIELTTLNLNQIVNDLKERGAKTIISFHEFKETPNALELERLARLQIEAGADICKLVTTFNKMADNITCLLFTAEMSQKTELACFAMGSGGLMSRVLSPIFGASFTYVSVDRGLETAKGQPSISDLNKIYKILGVDI